MPVTKQRARQNAFNIKFEDAAADSDGEFGDGDQRKRAYLRMSL